MEVVGGVVGLIGMTERILRLLTTAASPLDAPVHIIELLNQTQSFASVLNTLNDEALGNEALENELRLSKRTLMEINDLLRRHIDPRPTRWSKSRSMVKWVLKDNERAAKFRYELDRHTSRLGLLLNAENMKKARQDKDTADASGTIIAVMGVTGSGKSHLIQQIAGSQDVGVGDGLTSYTQDVRAYPMMIDNRVVTLVDTPGFDDTYRTDAAVFKDVATWLAKTYRDRKLLSGLIYTQPITSSRMSGSAVRSLDVFARLVGPDSFHNIRLVTTMWDLLPDRSVGERREDELRDNFWRALIEQGSITARSSGDRESTLAIVKSISFDQRMAPASGASLAIQREIVDEHKTLAETSAGEFIARRMDEMEKRHAEQIKQYKEEMAHLQNEIGELKGGQSSITSPQEQIEQFKEEVARLQNEMSELKGGQSSITGLQVVKADVSVRMGVQELLDIGPPPPYVPKALSNSDKVVEILKKVAMFWLASIDFVAQLALFSLIPVRDIQQLVRRVILRFMRPKLGKDYSRIEWTCSCGDFLYGDFVERAPGSLQNLAAKLGGRVVSGPAIQSIPVTSNVPPASPLAAYLGGRPTGGPGQAPSSIQQYTSNQQHGPMAHFGVGAGSSNALVVQPMTATPKWLELCIRSSPDTYVLREINVAGTQTDQSVFEKIKNEYWAWRTTPRLLNYFKLRVPNGGVFVQFRKDKLVTPNRSSATASVMTRPSVPTPQEAQTYKYSFTPVPMDEPPMAKHLFNHYFHKPHFADVAATWVTRFPQLNDSSLFYSNQKLAKGWGIEITEERNWMLFLFANLLSLSVSGAVAGVSSHYMKDRQTGVAIGAWLTAVQTLILTALFWHWTNV